MSSRIASVGLVLGLILGACGSPADGPTAADPEPNLPILGVDDAPAFLTTAVTGTLRNRGTGCWRLSLPDADRLVVFPEGWSESDDGETLIDPAAEPSITSGDRIEGTGGVVTISQLPEPTATWIGGCDPAATDVVILASVGPFFDTDALSTGEWVDLLESAEFTESWSCGIGFAASTADQRVAIVVYAMDMGITPPATVSLPDPGWSATVRLGSRLMANWCNDAIEVWAAEPVTVAEWNIGGGTLAHEPVPGIGCLPEPITGTLSGAIVATPSGPVTLDTVEMVNTAYGCFAG